MLMYHKGSDSEKLVSSGAETVTQLEVAMVFSAPKFVVKILIRFVDMADYRFYGVTFHSPSRR